MRAFLWGSAAFVCLGFAADIAAAADDVTISRSATRNMTFSGGEFSPTGKNAVLNVGDLENALAGGSVTVTTGSAGNQTGDLTVKTGLSWTAGSSLTLDAFHSIDIENAVSVAGAGGLTFTTHDGGTGGNLFFGYKGNVTFSGTSNALVIDGQPYTLEGTLPALAGAIASNPSGSYALANSYDASNDGTYSTSPITATFTGSFNGLGNAIANLTIVSDQRRAGIGLFSLIGSSASVSSLDLTRVSITAIARAGNGVGALAGLSEGSVFNDRADGTLAGGSRSGVGGLLGGNSGTVNRSSAAANVSGGRFSLVGGLVGSSPDSTSQITTSFATGKVKGSKTTGEIGGLVGANGGAISNSYAEGSAKGGPNSYVGGLVGDTGLGTIASSYSTGHVSAKSGDVGGFSGLHESGTFQDSYWDTETSGTDQGTGGGSSDGLTGLTTEEFQSGLPAGFDPSVWAEDATINNGFPYLIDNPPEK